LTTIGIVSIFRKKYNKYSCSNNLELSKLNSIMQKSVTKV